MRIAKIFSSFKTRKARLSIGAKAHMYIHAQIFSRWYTCKLDALSKINVARLTPQSSVVHANFYSRHTRLSLKNSWCRCVRVGIHNTRNMLGVCSGASERSLILSWCILARKHEHNTPGSLHRPPPIFIYVKSFANPTNYRLHPTIYDMSVVGLSRQSQNPSAINNF